MGKVLLWLVFSIAILHVSGWDFGIVYHFGGGSMHLQENGFYFRIGDDWYGGEFHPRYFDSPFLSWLALALVTGFVIIPIF